MSRTFDYFDLPDNSRRGFVVTAIENDRDSPIPSFLQQQVLWTDCPRWVTNAHEVVGDLRSYRLVDTQRVDKLTRAFYFAPNLSTQQTNIPFRAYADLEPSMYWPRVLSDVRPFRRLDRSWAIRFRYKNPYNGPTRTLVEEFYSPVPFQIPTYQAMMERGLNEEIGYTISLGATVGQLHWVSIGTVNMLSCLHPLLEIIVPLDPPVTVPIGNTGNVTIHNTAQLYQTEPATNFTDWPDTLVIDDRQRQVLGGWLRRRVTAYKPLETIIT